MSNQSLVWRIGGAQGHGVDSASTLFARSSAKLGFHVLGRREYHSNIIGRHSYSDVRISNRQVGGHCASPDILLCLDPESLCRHINTITEQGCIVIDAADIDVDLTSLKFLDASLKKQLLEQLSLTKQPSTISGLLACLPDKKFTVVKIPFATFSETLQNTCAVPRSLAARSKNIAMVAVSAAILNITEAILVAEIERVFAGKQKAVELSCLTIHLAYEYVKTAIVQSRINLPENVKANEQRLWINGYQSVALGKLAAGMGMQPYYPISPATDESHYLEAHQTVPLLEGGHAGPLVIQTEDELAAITMACGAALTGARVATSTSGPGFSLMVEGLGWAGMNEVPVVVTLYQRGGPSTGMPTRTEQGDLQFVLNAGHGEFPRIVLASGDVQDCFYDACRAFNYAERYQLPVIHMLDKNLASTSETVLPFDEQDLRIERGELAQARNENESEQHMPRFQITDNGLSPRPGLGESGQRFWTTGVEHSEWGQVCEDPLVRTSMMEKRARKLALAADEIPLVEKLATYGNEQATLTIVSWGSNKGVVVETVEQLNREGQAVRAIMVKLLWPLPVTELQKLIRKNDTLVVVECNQSGQFNRLLKEQLGREADHLILKYTGRPFSLEEISQSMHKIISGQAEKIMIHANPFE